jgi:transcriptional regulator with GAF, ATPase, and Fis domain
VATNRDLKEEVEQGRFREDLYYRLSVVPINLPPLRERDGDVPLLVQYFFDLYRNSLDAAATEIAPQTMALLDAYPWPGNVRELRNIIERMLVLDRDTRTLSPRNLPDDIRSDDCPVPRASESFTLAEAVSNYERQLIEEALRAANGVQTRAAKALGTTRRILKYRMEKLGIR